MTTDFIEKTITAIRGECNLNSEVKERELVLKDK